MKLIERWQKEKQASVVPNKAIKKLSFSVEYPSTYDPLAKKTKNK